MQASSGLAIGDQITGARDDQEDFFQIIEFPRDGDVEGRLLILADGMGGHVGGARAGQLAATVFAAHFEQTGDDGGDIGQRLRKSLDAANAAIGEDSAKDPRYIGMGCTLLACLITDNELYWISVGDSPMWLLRENSMTRLNASHSMRPVLEALVELGRMSAEELETDSRVHQLRSALMGDELSLVDQNKSALPLVAADRIILASDGLETLTVDEIGNICSMHSDPEKTVAALLGEVEARQRAGQDNTTAIIYIHKDRPVDATGAQSIRHGG